MRCLAIVLLLAVSALAHDFFDILLTGIWEAAPEFLRTSSPGSRLSFYATGAPEFEVEGDAFWEVFVDGERVTTLQTSARKSHKISKDLGKERHLVEVVLRSELLPGEVRVYSVSGALSAPKASTRRIEFIGDSFTVGYGVEAKSVSDGTPFETTNTTKSYAYLLAQKLRADYKISAFSGRGLTRNYANLEPEWTVPKLMECMVPGTAKTACSARDFTAWHPQVIVIFLGINDFQGELPVAKIDDFVTAYRALLSKLRAAHPGVKFLLVSTKCWPRGELTGAVEKVYELERAGGKTDLEVVDVSTENTALQGHPNERSQAELAQTLLPIVARLGGFLSR